jgi:hypothetical protein
LICGGISRSHRGHASHRNSTAAGCCDARSAPWSSSGVSSARDGVGEPGAAPPRRSRSSSSSKTGAASRTNAIDAEKKKKVGVYNYSL